MKRLLLLLTITLTTLVPAQETIEKTVGEFTELKVYDLLEVELVESNINKVEITGQSSENVLINNKNGSLKIKMKLEKLLKGDNTKVTLYYTGLDVIDANEGSKVYGSDVIKQFEIDLKAQEGASIKVPVDVSYTNIKAVTGGIVEVTGVSESQKVTLLTGGIYKGENLQTKKTDVTVNAAGQADVKASVQVDAKVRAGGNVNIYGNPKTVNETTVIGGNIKIIDKKK
ncbi:head GIN domain-containing protein [Gaetbulibacter saemankumensis]|uniref:head GIN domain-containing protein n=1 Tax=Gaetbulibacter saemankumensis TaxID=311208 RepID=UPI000415949A|nr:head GIN domain-containing protein [Gaetbulibacter saemankumensis]